MTELLKDTRERTIRWRPGSRDDQALINTSLASIVVESADGDGVAPYRVRVLNSGGVTIASEEFRSGSSGFELASDLYQAAHNNSQRVDETLDSLVEQLESGTFSVESDEPPF